MNFFSKVTYQLQPKNKLQGLVQDAFYEENQKLVLSIDAFLENLQKKVGALNAQFKRCKPIEVSLHDYKRYQLISKAPDHYTISAPELIQITLYVVRNPLEAIPSKPKPSKFNPFQLHLFHD